MGEQYNIALGRLLNQFKNSPNILTLLEAFFTEIESTQTLVEYLRDSLDLDNAEGVWLDVIGVILGLERPYKEQDPNTIFTVKGRAQPDIITRGCLDTATGVGGYLQSHAGLTDLTDPAARETDTNYRKLLRAKTFANNQLGTFTDLYTFLFDGFDVRSDIESTDTGLVLITLYNFLSQRERRYVEAYAPLLAGVAVEFVNWPTYPSTP